MCDRPGDVCDEDVYLPILHLPLETRAGGWNAMAKLAIANRHRVLRYLRPSIPGGAGSIVYAQKCQMT